MTKKRPQRRDSAPGSDVSAILGIEKEKTYQERKQEYDRNRVRLRVDVPTWLKDAIEEEADGQRVSMSQLSAFFLAYALRLYCDGDTAILELLEKSKTQITSLRWAFGIELSDLEEILTDSADSDENADLLDF